MKTNLVLVGLFVLPLLSCSGAYSEAGRQALWDGGECATPEDAVGEADVTLTATDAVLEVRDGVPFHAWTYDGDVPGPVLRMEVGETRRIKLVNESPRPASIHFHGMGYLLADDGTYDTPESVVNPGCSHIYTITANTPGVWPYHSHLETRAELAQGLYGAIVVPAPGEVPADREFVLFLGQLGIENEEGEGEEEEEEGEEGSAFAMTFNGRPDGTGPAIEWDGSRYAVSAESEPTVRLGDHLRWRVVNVSPDDWHTFGVHNHSFCDRGGLPDDTGLCPSDGQIINILDVSPLKGFTLEFMETKPGRWMYHCHIIDHVAEGMSAYYEAVP